MLNSGSVKDVQILYNRLRNEQYRAHSYKYGDILYCSYRFNHIQHQSIEEFQISRNITERYVKYVGTLVHCVQP